METKKHILNAYYQRLSEVGSHLSDDAKSFIKQYEDYDYIVNFFAIALEYARVIEERFFCEDFDDEDYEILRFMILTIDSISELIMKYETEISFVLEEDDDED